MSDTTATTDTGPAGRLSIVGFSRAAAAGLTVGKCTTYGCDGRLYAERSPYTVGAVVWLESKCNACGATYASPNGHTVEDAEHRARERWRAGQPGYVTDGPGRTVGQPTGEFTR